MTDSYSVVHIPRTDLIAISNGVPLASSAQTEAHYQIVGSDPNGEYVSGPYYDEREARIACARLNSGVRILYLPNFNRLLSEKSGSIIVESGIELFVGLNRKQSERYAHLHTGDVTDEFIELNRIHKRVLTGIEDL